MSDRREKLKGRSDLRAMVDSGSIDFELAMEVYNRDMRVQNEHNVGIRYMGWHMGGDRVLGGKGAYDRAGVPEVPEGAQGVSAVEVKSDLFFCTEHHWYKRPHCDMWGCTQCLACEINVALNDIVRRMFGLERRKT